MASAAEQLAANMSLGVFSKATELKQRLWFTLAALIVYRIGTYIPIPGVDGSVMAEMMPPPCCCIISAMTEPSTPGIGR